MSRRQQLNLYIAQLQRRLRLDASLRGAAIIAAAALAATLVLTLILNAYAFPEHALGLARIVLLLAVIAAAGFGLALPWLRLNQRRAIDRAEATFPELNQRLLTFAERDQAADPFIELLAADTLAIAGDAPPERLVPQKQLMMLTGAGVLATLILVWLIVLAPGFVGYGASLLWTGPRHGAAPLYDIHVTPGDAAVRRNSDQLVTAQVVGVDPSKVTLYARYQSASKWEPVAMQALEGHTGYQFLFAGLPESVEYYVEAGPVKSKHFNFRVVDLPGVKQIQVQYHYPRWTGLQPVSEEHAGDLRALEGTDAQLTVEMDSPLKDGMLALDNGQPLHLTAVPGEANQYQGTIHIDKDGAYHVAAVDHGQQVRLSEDYFISASKANLPQIAISRPGADYRASPIEEVTVGVHAGADFGLSQAQLHYSVNGGPEKTVNVLKQPGAKTSDGTATLNLEDFKMVPGDVISLYATAKDAHAESRTDISFIQADPFEREFSQSQQSGGGGGGGGGGQGNQTDISRREKELIAATWKQANAKDATAQQSNDLSKTLSEAQRTLQEQALALSARMQSRDLAEANEEFNSFEADMQKAAAAMEPSAEKLKSQAWKDALPNEQKALQALLRAEATFRQIEVAFGQRGGGGGGGGGSAGRDLASLFDLELDTEKNQYETAQTGSPAEEQAKKVDEALEKLDALAKRQEELAQQQNGKPQDFQQRWQQEMLRREAEQLQRDMEQMQGQQSGQQSADGQSGQGGQSGQSGQSRSQSSQSGQQSASNGSSNSAGKDGAADPRVTQALERLRAANDNMRRAGGQSGQPGQSSADEAKRAADRLREATDLLGGAQKQQATGKLDSLAQQAQQMAKEEASQADRIHQLASKTSDGTQITQQQYSERIQERNRLASERQDLSSQLSQTEKNLRDTAREMAPTQPGTASKLRDALGEMDQSDLDNLTQRTADWLRRGIDPNSNGTEGQVASGLKKLNEQLQQAQQSAGSERGTPGQGNGKDESGTQMAALNQMEKLRSQLQGLPSPQTGSQARSQSGPQAGSQRGWQSGQQPLSRGQQGQGQQGQGQGQRQGQQSGQQNGQQAGNQQGGTGGNGQPGGKQRGGITGQAGQRGGGGTGSATNNTDTGGQKFDRNAKPNLSPDTGAGLGDSEKAIQQGLQELNQVRQLAKSDPAAERQIQELVKEMQQLDPSRFPGNPEVVEQLHARVLNDVDKLELQLEHDASANQSDQTGQARTSKPAPVPTEYQDAVAEYYRRLGKSQ